MPCAPTQNWRQCSCLSDSSTAKTPSTCGVTKRVSRMRYAKEKGVSRVTPSCQLCLPWVSIHFSSKSMPPCRHALHHEAGIQVNLCKTKSGMVRPSNPRTWTSLELRLGKAKDLRRRGLVVPVGHSAFVRKWFADKEGFHLQLLARIPAVQDAQCAWLLLLMCAGPRANHILRNLPPSEVSDFGQHHDNHLLACLADIIAMAVPDGVTTGVVQLPFREEG